MEKFILDIYIGYGGGIVGSRHSDNFHTSKPAHNNQVINSYSTDKSYRKAGNRYVEDNCCGIGATDMGQIAIVNDKLEYQRTDNIKFYSVISSFWDKDITKDGGPNWSSSIYKGWKNYGMELNIGNGKAMGKSTADMKKKSTYTT